MKKRLGLATLIFTGMMTASKPAFASSAAANRSVYLVETTICGVATGVLEQDGRQEMDKFLSEQGANLNGFTAYGQIRDYATRLRVYSQEQCTSSKAMTLYELNPPIRISIDDDRFFDFDPVGDAGVRGQIRLSCSMTYKIQELSRISPDDDPTWLTAWWNRYCR